MVNSLVKKICILGPEGVGKTSLIRRFVDNSFSEEYLSTIGVQISQKDLKISEDKKIQFIIWDLEGFDISKDYPLTYLSGAAALIFVCDSSRAHTSSELIRIYKSIAEQPNFKVPTCIALNKSDLVDKKECNLLLEQFKNNQDFSPDVNFFMTSAKDDLNVLNMFEVLGQEIWKSYDS